MAKTEHNEVAIAGESVMNQIYVIKFDIANCDIKPDYLDELILAIDLYCKLEPRQIHALNRTEQFVLRHGKPETGIGLED